MKETASGAVEARLAGLFRPLGFGLLLLAGLAGSFPMVMAGLESFFYRDYGVLGYPFLFHYRESLWHGEFPFWNPLSNCGAPFAAQWGPMAYYPGALAYLLFPLPWSLAYFCLAHLFLAGLGMYYLARRWTGNDFASALAGWAFVFNGATLACLIWPNYTVALGWMPWLVLLAERAAQQGGRSLLWAALVAAMQVLAGAPELTVFTWLIILALAVAEAVARRATWLDLVKRLGLVILLAAGLTAVQILPFLDLLSLSQRDASFATNRWAMPGWGWANLLVPLFHCFQTPQGIFFQDGQAFLSSYYPGVAVLILAIWGVGWKNGRHPKLLAALALFSLVLALGDDGILYPMLRKIFPALGFARFPVKFVLLAAFLFPLLAALALTALDKEPPPIKRLLGRAIISWLGVALLVGLILAHAYRQPFPYDQPEVTRHNALARLAFLAVSLAFLVLASKARLRLWAQIGLLAALWFDIRLHAPRQNPSLPVGLFAPGLWELDQKMPPPRHGVARVMISAEAEDELNNSKVVAFDKNWLGKRLALWSNLNLLERIPKVNGSSTLQIREQREVEDLLYKRPRSKSPALLDFLAVRHVTAPGTVVGWTNRSTAMPPITAGQQPVFVAGTNALWGLLSASFNPRETVFLPSELAGAISATNRAKARIETATFTANRVEARVNSRTVCLVVVAQTFHPNWKAWVDDKPIPVWRANHAFQAVEVPAGRHDLRLVYVDNHFKVGLAISLLALAAWTIAWKLTSRKPSPKSAADFPSRGAQS